MKPGFTLIEVLVVLAIVAIMGGMLFTSLTQINFGAQVADTMIDETNRALIMHQQIEKDFMGAMVPVAAVFEEEEKKAQQQNSKKAPTPQPAPGAKIKEQAEEKKEKTKPVTKVFFGNARDGNLDTLTFITNNPLTVFWNEKVGKAKPRIARVVYRLVPQKDVKDTFTLKRQEDSELQFDAYKVGGSKEIREFILADNIKSFSVEYSYVVEPKEEKDKNKETEKKKREVKTEKEWNSDEKEQKKKRNDKEFPDWITVKCVLWDLAKKRFQEYEFKIEHLALGLPPTNKVDEPAAPQQPQQPQQPELPGKLNELANAIDGMLGKARNQLFTANKPSTTRKLQ